MSALFIAAVARFNSRVAILHIQPVQALDAPELALYLTLKRVEEHERAGVLVAANLKVVKRLLASRFTVVSALLTPEWLAKLEPQLRARPEAELPIHVAEQKVLETITGYKVHQGALAVAKIPPLPDLETLLKNSPRPLLLAAVEGIASAENLGAVVRSCAAFGAHFLIVGETCGSPFQRRAVQGSMGTIFEQPVVRVENLVETFEVVACARSELPRGASASGREEIVRRGFARRLLSGVRCGRAGLTVSACWRRAMTQAGNPDAEPHEFAERGRGHGNFSLRSNAAARVTRFQPDILRGVSP